MRSTYESKNCTLTYNLNYCCESNALLSLNAPSRVPTGSVGPIYASFYCAKITQDKNALGSLSLDSFSLQDLLLGILLGFHEF